jgi:hypothetical protein
MATTSLLEDLRDHIQATALAQAATLIFRLHNFTDADLTNAAPVILLRRSGTGGDDDEIGQQIDVDVILLTAPTAIKSGEDLLHTLRLFLKSDAGMVGPGTYGYVVASPIIGPVQLQNGRQRFMFMVRCFTENQ